MESNETTLTPTVAPVTAAAEPAVPAYIPYLALGEFFFMELAFSYGCVNYSRIVYDMVRKQGAFKSPKSLSLRIHVTVWFVMCWEGLLHTSYLLFWWRMPRNYNLYIIYWIGTVDSAIDLATPFAATLLNFETMLIISLSPITMERIMPAIRLFAGTLMILPLPIIIIFMPQQSKQAFEHPREVCWDYACLFFMGNSIFFLVKWLQALLYIIACVGLLVAIRLHNSTKKFKGKRDSQAESIVKFSICVEVLVKLIPQAVQYYLSSVLMIRLGYVTGASVRVFIALDGSLNCWKYSKTLLPSPIVTIMGLMQMRPKTASHSRRAPIVARPSHAPPSRVPTRY